MNSFVGETGLQIFYFSAFWIIPMIFIAWIAALLAIVLSGQQRDIAISSFVSVAVVVYTSFLIFIRFGQEKWDFVKPIADKMKKFEDHTKLIFGLIFNQVRLNCGTSD